MCGGRVMQNSLYDAFLTNIQPREELWKNSGETHLGDDVLSSTIDLTVRIIGDKDSLPKEV